MIVLSPWVRTLEDDGGPRGQIHCRVPGLVGGVFDLRNEMQRRNPGSGPLAPGWALAVVTPGRQHPDSIRIGDDWESQVNDAAVATIQTDLGLGEAIVSRNPKDIAAELMIHHGDPVGVSRWAMPSPVLGAFLLSWWRQGGAAGIRHQRSQRLPSFGHHPERAG